MVVIWETDNLLRAPTLEWGWEPGRAIFSQHVQTTFVDDCHFVHKAEIPYNNVRFHDSIVQQRREVFYKVKCGGEESELFRFITPITSHTASDESVKIAVISDNQYGSNVLRHIAHDIQGFQPDLLLMAGDVVNRGYLLEEWAMYFWHPLEESLLAQRTPIAMARGNHDGESPLAFAYTAGLRNRDWFAFTLGSIRFVILDSNADTATCPQQREWMKTEFASKEFTEALFR